MKTTHLYHSRVNFTSRKDDRRACEASLRHSLRITHQVTKGDIFVPLETKSSIQWLPELLAYNKIYINGKITRLDQWGHEEKWDLLYQVAPTPKLHMHKKLQSQRSSYKHKIMKTIASLLKAGNDDVAEFLNDILNTKGRCSYSKISRFKLLQMTYKAQRIKMLEKYLNAHNQLVSFPHANSLYVQEGIFKIPAQWNVSNKLITTEEYIHFTEFFLKHHFPEYPILFVVAHDDERSVDEDTGAHSHYFLSGRNSITDEFDLLKAQVSVVNKYIQLQHPETKIELAFNKKGKLSRLQNKLFGEYFQRLVFDFANKHLLHAKGLHAELAPESERRSEQRKQMNRESKLPKEERTYNFQNRLIEAQQAKLAELEQQTQIQKQLLDETVMQQSIAQGELMMQEDQKEQNDQEITIQQKTITELRTERRKLERVLDSLKEGLIEPLSRFCQQVFLGLKAQQSGQQKMVESFLDTTMKEMLMLPPHMQTRAKILLKSVDLEPNKMADRETQQLDK
ncbi:hypothetical protein G6Z94_06910 [Vibrio aestuarianus]|uniref:hypothetical protein n=1 Tax=Vibrio aestuarianus TaxID=28171 RepID=UPI0015935C31|nr:hypothetical protein [Vibrio aestuarianus]NGZ17084.1 hypothetical protein [Vibrio aestuarianus]